MAKTSTSGSKQITCWDHAKQDGAIFSSILGRKFYIRSRKDTTKVYATGAFINKPKRFAQAINCAPFGYTSGTSFKHNLHVGRYSLGIQPPGQVKHLEITGSYQRQTTTQLQAGFLGENTLTSEVSNIRLNRKQKRTNAALARRRPTNSKQRKRHLPRLYS